MKKFKIMSFCFALVTAISFTGCQNEALDEDLLENVEEEQPAGPAVFKVDFGGETFVASTAMAQVQGNTVNISGVRGTAGETVALTIIGGTSTGNYTNAVQMYVPSATTGMFYSNMNPSAGGVNGSVVITNINTSAHTISGTFSFTGHYNDPTQNLPSVAFTNGSFQNIPYTGTMPGTEPEPQPNTKYFKAKVDGTMTNFPNVVGFHLANTYSLSGTNGIDMMTITMPDNITAGTYPIGDDLDGVMATYMVQNPQQESYSSLPGGSITIISVGGGWVKGTFSYSAENFDGDDTIQVTEGSFNVQLQ